MTFKLLNLFVQTVVQKKGHSFIVCRSGKRLWIEMILDIASSDLPLYARFCILGDFPADFKRSRSNVKMVSLCILQVKAAKP